MPLRLGAGAVTDLRVGSSEVTAAYVGADQVWPDDVLVNLTLRGARGGRGIGLEERGLPHDVSGSIWLPRHVPLVLQVARPGGDAASSNLSGAGRSGYPNGGVGGTHSPNKAKGTSAGGGGSTRLFLEELGVSAEGLYVVSAGGGGAAQQAMDSQDGFGAGGDAGVPDGGEGGDSGDFLLESPTVSTAFGGDGGTQSAGGAGGTGQRSSGSAGSFSAGGPGASFFSSDFHGSGGGGGGGWYGGGGGAHDDDEFGGGGGGGSSLVSKLESGYTVSAPVDGDGYALLEIPGATNDQLLYESGIQVTFRITFDGFVVDDEDVPL